MRNRSHHQVLPHQYTDDESEDNHHSSHRRERQIGPEEGVGNGIRVPRRQITDRSYVDNENVSEGATEGDSAQRQQRQPRREAEGADQSPLISLEREDWGT